MRKFALVVAVTGSLAAVSMWFALTGAARLNSFLSAALALLWALAVVGIDRWLVTSAPATGRARFIQVSILRLLVALALGIVISVPLVLQIFQPGIDHQIEVTRQQHVSQLTAQLSQANEQAIYWDAQAATLKKVISSDNPATYDTTLAKLIEQQKAAEDKAQQAYRCEVLGESVNCPPGSGARAQSSYQQAVSQLSSLQAQIQSRASQLIAADAAKLVKYQQATASLPGALRQQNAALAHGKALRNSLAALNGTGSDAESKLEAASQLFGDNVAIATAMALAFMLFLLIESSPVTVKVLQGAGSYGRVPHTPTGHAAAHSSRVSQLTAPEPPGPVTINEVRDSAVAAGDWNYDHAPALNVNEDEPRPRFLTALLPERAPAGARIPLLVQVTLDTGPRASAALDAFTVGPSGTTVTITVSAPGLIPAGDLEQELTVPPDADSRPVRFGFIAGPTGLHVVEIRAFTGGTCLGELALQISVEPGAALEEGRPRAAPMAGFVAEPGEVTLQVSRTAGGGYSFQLLSEALYPMVLIDRLAGDPSAVVGQMIAELRAMAKGQSPFGTPALVRKRLRSLGTTLWADVVPDAIREQFWGQRDRIRLFTIASDIDTVPWELLYPVDLDNENGFLVEQFPVVRRVYGQGRARALRLDQGAGFVIPSRSPASAMSEVAAVQATLPPGVVHRGTESGLAAVHELLDAMPSVLHFAGHSTFTDETGSLISLQGGPLRPGDLSYAKQKRAFEAVRPLVFLNGCRTAAEIPGFTQMNGWAKEFMGAGAGAFIGSLWAVRSDSARRFAEEFYSALICRRQPLGAASLQARQAIATDEGDPTWLAYTVYGNPSASLAYTPYQDPPVPAGDNPDA